jgi:LacI family transcriptional regulator
MEPGDHETRWDRHAGRGRVTIAHLAEAAGVSKATVSRALSGHPDIGARTRQRVAEVARDLGYTPGVSGRALRTGRFTSLGLVVPFGTWSWFGELQRGAAEEAGRLGYTLLLHALGEGKDAERDFVERVMPSLPIDGLVLLMPEGLLPLIAERAEHGLPVVMIDDRRPEAQFSTVAVDNAEGARALTAHLLRLGRRRIAFVGGALKDAYTRERLQGYRRALTEAGIEDDASLVIVGQERELTAAEVLDALANGLELDAVFACYDELAFELLEGFRAAGRKVPEEVAVVGFDDIPPARLVYPALTTARQPFYEMGATAVRMLRDGVEGKQLTERVVLPASLVVRESCGAALTAAGGLDVH